MHQLDTSPDTAAIVVSAILLIITYIVARAAGHRSGIDIAARAQTTPTGRFPAWWLAALAAARERRDREQFEQAELDQKAADLLARIEKRRAQQDGKRG